MNRSFGVAPADRGRVTQGAYRFFSHPIYLGYALSEAALVTAAPGLWNGCILTGSLGLYAFRARAEDRLLSAVPVGGN